MSRKIIIQNYQLKADKHFLLPEIQTIGDFIEQTQVSNKAPGRLYYPLETWRDKIETKTLYAQAFRPHGKAASSRCEGHVIGRYEVLKGGYPDNLALLRATDPHGINNIWISLIDWADYEHFIQEALS